MNNPQNTRIYCLSHLEWNQSLFQRPQQFMLRLSKKHNVDFFCQIPTKEYYRSKLPFVKSFNEMKINQNLDVKYFPYTPFAHKSMRKIKSNRTNYTGRIRNYIEKQKDDEFVLWLYHPKDFEVLIDLNYSLLVYDCMDDFKEFMGAEQDLKNLEGELLKKADIVFTGGKHMFDAKASKSKECYFLPCGVEYDHFAQKNHEKPEIIKDIKEPIAGYFGAIDERLDLDLLNYVADSFKDINFLFLGPVLKIDYSELFNKSNVHYLGEIDYSALPSIAAYMDVCMIPFSLTELTMTMNPTKTLEYFALGKPVVTTPLPDVVDLFGEHVYVAEKKEDFAKMLKKALENENADVVETRKRIARENSWESAVEFIEENIQRLLKEKRGF